MDNQVKTREWVKTAAIIFLAVLLVLTFFSNTILNASLKPVMGQTVQGGSIKARISGQGMVKADETYDITINQTRKIASVKAKVGKPVEVGDVLFVLEAQQSTELKEAQTALTALQLSYDKALIEASNSAATTNREVQKAQEEYDEALALYQKTAGMDPESLALAIQTLTDEKTRLEGEKNFYNSQQAAVQREKSEWETARSTAAGETSNAKQALSDAQSALSAAGYDLPTKTAAQLSEEVERTAEKMKSFENAHSSDVIKYGVGGAFLAKASDGDFQAMKNLTTQPDNLNYLVSIDKDASVDIPAAMQQYGYSTAAAYIADAFDKLTYETDKNYSLDAYENARATAQLAYAKANSSLRSCESAESKCKSAVDSCDSQLDHISSVVADLDLSIASKAAEIEELKSASTMVDTVKQKKQALEDKIFEANKGNPSALDLEDTQRQIEQKQKEVDDLIANSDEIEIKSNVAGIVASVNTSAGQTAGKDEVLATVNLVDKGYTIKIPVTADQARRVSIGDVAETNAYGSAVTATLESIAANPESKDGGKLLVFRLTGDVTPDQNLTISIGQKSQNYDVVIPKAAYRSDSNGTFVYVLTVKKTPLNNRYVAKRVDVSVLAEDDSNYAVSGLNYGDFIIVNVNGQITDGEEVRLAENAG